VKHLQNETLNQKKKNPKIEPQKNPKLIKEGPNRISGQKL